MTGVRIRGTIWMAPLPRLPRRVYTLAIKGGDVLAIVSEGASTPWRWSMLPGVSVRTLMATRPDTATVDRICEHFRGDPCDCALVHRLYEGFARTPWLRTERWPTDPPKVPRGTSTGARGQTMRPPIG